MCQFDHLKVGEIVDYNSSGATCDDCACPKEFHTKAVYAGHVLSRRYGMCDVFNFYNPVICSECGSACDYALVPCGDMEFGLIQHEYAEKVERA